MSDYREKDKFKIPKHHFKSLPLMYKYLYSFKYLFVKKSNTTYGIPVDRYNTTSYFPEGHHKPISKIVNLAVFENQKKKFS
jgi:hypothetical protein